MQPICDIESSTMKPSFIFAVILALVPCFLQAQTPTLSQAAGKVGVSSNEAGSASNFEMYMDPSGYPRAVTLGETVFSMGSWPSGQTPTFSDDKSNTWAAVTSCTDSQSMKHGFFYAVDAAAGTSVITHTYSSSVNNEVFDWAHFYNMSTSPSGFVDGNSCLAGVTPSNNTAPNISGTPYTVGTTGDLILTCVYVENRSLAAPNAISSISWPTGFTGLNEDPSYGHACAYGIGTAGSFTPTFTFAQSTQNSFTIMSAAFKAGTGGSIPGNGASIALQETQYDSGARTVKSYLPCPTTTTAVAVLDDDGSVTEVSDSGGSSWSHVSSPGNDFGVIYYTNSPVISSPNSYTVSVTFNSGGYAQIGLMCLVNTAGLDTVTAQNGSSQNGSNSAYGTATVSGGRANYAPSVSTAHARSLIIDIGAMGTGPVESCVTGQCVFDFVGSTSWSNGDNESYANGDLMAHYYASTASTTSFDFNIESGSSSTTSGVALAFLQSSSSSTPAPPSGLSAVVH